MPETKLPSPEIPNQNIKTEEKQEKSFNPVEQRLE